MQYIVRPETKHLENGDVEIRVYVDCPNGKSARAAFRITARELDAVEDKQHLIQYYEQRTLSRGMTEAYGANRT